MLAAMNALPGVKNKVPAVVHVDNTVRIHVVDRKTSPYFWKLLNEFYQLTGVPILINTSFNIQEPIICSPKEAINTFLRSKINYLVLENFLCKRK
jgi:carbamoyltransferase